MGAANHETQLQTIDQGMADAEADHDMADDRTTLVFVQVRAGVEREMAFMESSVLVNRATV